MEHDASWHGSPDKPRRTLSQDGRAMQRPTPKSPQQMDGVAKHAANHAVSAVTSASCVVQPLRDSFKRRVTSGSERQAENQRGLSLEDPLPPFKDVLKRYFETQSQSTLSSQASEPAAMKTRPRRAATEPALWTVHESASEGGDGTEWGQQIAGNGGSGDGLNCDPRFGVPGQATSEASDVELIQTLQRMC